MVDKSIVDIKTGQPVKPSGPSSGEQRKALNHDGKRWRKLQQKMADGEIQISVTAAGQELDMDDMIIPFICRVFHTTATCGKRALGQSARAAKPDTQRS